MATCKSKNVSTYKMKDGTEFSITRHFIDYIHDGTGAVSKRDTVGITIIGLPEKDSNELREWMNRNFRTPIPKIFKKYIEENKT
jgi:hypothetical protein